VQRAAILEQEARLCEIASLQGGALGEMGYDVPPDLSDDPLVAMQQQWRAVLQQIREKAATRSSGNVAGGDFLYDIKRWWYEDNTLHLEGEVTNSGGTGWTTAIFSLGVYDGGSGALLGTAHDITNNLDSGQTKAFSTYSRNVDRGDDLSFQISFEGGVER
jgi:hypothetical protein